MKVILVLGSVTAKQYDPVRQAVGMAYRGEAKHVIRIGSEHRFEGLANIDEAHKMFGTSDDPEDDARAESLEAMEEHQQSVLGDAFAKRQAKGVNATQGDIVAVLYDQPVEEDGWEWMDDFLPPGTGKYYLQQLESDRWRVTGEGFGSKLNHIGG